jgi:hypothetical protein
MRFAFSSAAVEANCCPSAILVEVLNPLPPPSIPVFAATEWRLKKA